MTTFKASTEGTDKLGLRAVLERYANDQWLPDLLSEINHSGQPVPRLHRTSSCQMASNPEIVVADLHAHGCNSSFSPAFFE